MNILKRKNVSERIVKSVLDIVNEKSKTELSSEKLRKIVKLENLMIRAYLNDPAINCAERPSNRIFPNAILRTGISKHAPRA